MLKITKLSGKNLLVERVADKNKSEYSVPGADERGAVFIVRHAGSNSEYQSGDHILMLPADYSALDFEGEHYLTATDEDVLAKLEEAK